MKQENLKLYKFSEDNEWYTTREDIQYFIDHIKIPKNKIIWCPFDLPHSNFVNVLQENGYNVISSHILEGKDFFTWEPQEHWDLILSNPPFAGKAKILERLKCFDKPFGLIFGIQAFNSGGFTRKLAEFKNVEFIMLAKRIKFVKDAQNYNAKKVPQPTFHSFWACSDLFAEREREREREYAL